MKESRMWTTFDREVFDTREAAEIHEAKVVKEWMNESLINPMDVIDSMPDDVEGEWYGTPRDIARLVFDVVMKQDFEVCG